MSSNAKLMDTEPGGENTQYESINTLTKPHAKEEGQFKDSSSTEASRQAQQEKSAKGEKTAENTRYGEAISEHGFGGETTGNSGDAQQGGYGRIDENSGAEGTSQVRRTQGYGPGSGVGA